MGLYLYDVHPIRTGFRNRANQIPAIPSVQLVNPFKREISILKPSEDSNNRQSITSHGDRTTGM